MRALLPGAPVDKGKQKKRQRGLDVGDDTDGGRPAGADTSSKKKRGLSGYTLFVKETRAAEVSANPGQTPTETMRRMGQEWQKLTLAEKQSWNGRAKASQDAIMGAD